MDPLFVQMIANYFRQASPPGTVVKLDGRGWVKLDAAVATAFVAQELEYVKSQTYDVKKIALKSRTFIPISHDAHPGAEVIAYDSYDSIGEAKIVESYAKDFPRVDADKKRSTDIIFSLGDSYGHSVQDLRAIAMSGSKLNVQRAMQARRAMEAKLDSIAAIGAPEKTGKTGLVNNADIDVFGTSLNWTLATAGKTIKANLNAIVQKVITNTKETFIPDTMLLPPKAFAVANSVPFSDVVPTSALKSFLDDSPYIQRVDQWTRLAGAGADGVKDRIVVYPYDKSVVELEISQEYEEMPPEVRGMEFLTHCHMRTGGTVIRYPGAFEYADGTFDPES